jgi:hypothetical protein
MRVDKCCENIKKKKKSRVTTCCPQTVETWRAYLSTPLHYHSFQRMGCFSFECKACGGKDQFDWTDDCILVIRRKDGLPDVWVSAVYNMYVGVQVVCLKTVLGDFLLFSPTIAQLNLTKITTQTLQLFSPVP